ncbi:MAG TPA: glycosyltransferase family 87 protein [Bryobacteraceae bacterium]|nr:glycosyltransferase family 87 protein [Bryobacteraceae bacterium]
MHRAWGYSANLATALVVGCCALIYIKLNVLAPIPGLPNPSDFYVYYHAGHDVLRGTSPFENFAYFYPPLVAFVMSPFALLDYVTARWIWFATSHVLLLATAFLLWRAMGRNRSAACSIACVWALGGAAKESLQIGQLNPVLVFALAIAYTERDKLRSSAVGVGFALKYIPGLLVAALFLHRRWSALVGFAGTVIAAFLLPWAVIRLAFTGPKIPVSSHFWMGTPSIFSWSIPSVVLRILTPIHRGNVLPHEWEFGNVAATLHLGTRLEWISAGTAIALLTVGTGALAWVCRGRLNRAQVPWAMAALVWLSLAAAPVCWSHYAILAYPGAAMLLAGAIRLRAWRMALGTAACFAASYQLPQWMLTRYHDAYGVWTAASPAALYLWTSIAPLASLGLFGIALVYVRRLGLRAAPDNRPAVPVKMFQGAGPSAPRTNRIPSSMHAEEQ